MSRQHVVETYEEMAKRHKQEYPYTVYHEDADPNEIPPYFKTWGEALAAQKEWNKEVSGHRARKR